MESYAARRAATSLFVVAVLALLAAAYVGLVYWEDTIGFGAGFIGSVSLFTWYVIFLVVLLVVLIALVILFFARARTPAEGDAAASALLATEPTEEPYGEAAEAGAVEGDPWARPASTELEAEVLEPGATVIGEADALLVKCTNCSNEFEIPYTTDRPIETACPRCGEDVVLHETERVLTTKGQPAIDIEGIGDVEARKLAGVGIHTTEQLRAASADRLVAQTGIAKGRIELWQAMADLLRLRGVGKQYAELLALAGIRSAAALASETPTRLVSKVEAYLGSVERAPTKARIDAKKAKRFIEVARAGRLDKGLEAD